MPPHCQFIGKKLCSTDLYYDMRTISHVCLLSIKTNFCVCTIQNTLFLINMAEVRSNSQCRIKVAFA